MPAEIREPGAGNRELDKAPAKIAGMFDEIAGRYDLLNTVLSGGMDRYWRRLAIRSLKLTGVETLLDVCAGTADVAIRGARQGAGAARVIGVDFSGAMLVHGNKKVRDAGLARRVHLVRGDAIALPVPDGSVHAVTIAFGIRNVQRADAACRELYRALKPGGRLAILEFGVPRFALFRVVYDWYFHQVVPRIGRAVSGHGAAYTYLPESVDAFQFGEEFAAILRAAGFSRVEARPLMFGAVYLYTAQRS
jgi:demethylmenaquinone methyltransferase/2-methoxy-6-polyprenyl-1,4-benzoquinol methylase